jgi:hypothetical protein
LSPVSGAPCGFQFARSNQSPVPPFHVLVVISSVPVPISSELFPRLHVLQGHQSKRMRERYVAGLPVIRHASMTLVRTQARSSLAPTRSSVDA